MTLDPGARHVILDATERVASCRRSRISFGVAAMKGFPHSAWILAAVGAAALLMGGCGMLGGRTHEERILAALRSEDRADGRKTLLDLEGQATPAVREAVERILATDMEPRTRAIAADALGRSGMQECAAELRQSAREDSHWIVRVRALRALVQILGSRAAEDLEFSLKNDPDPTVRVEAVKLAAPVLPEREAARLIVEGLKDRAQEVKLAAWLELENLTGQEISPNDYDRWYEYVRGP